MASTNELAVREALTELAKSKTLVIVVRKLSTIEHTDQILLRHLKASDATALEEMTTDAP